MILQLATQHCIPIRDFPDHATFREKGAALACADKADYNKSNTMVFKKCETGKK